MRPIHPSQFTQKPLVFASVCGTTGFLVPLYHTERGVEPRVAGKLFSANTRRDTHWARAVSSANSNLYCASSQAIREAATGEGTRPYSSSRLSRKASRRRSYSSGWREHAPVWATPGATQSSACSPRACVNISLEATS